MRRSPPHEDLYPWRQASAPPRLCEHPGCLDAGTHRAPRDRDHLTEYRFFCLPHVRAYNAAWNFYAGMDEAEIERHLRNDTVWNRPTWPLGGGRAGHPRFRHMGDPFGVFEEEEGAAQRPRRPAAETPETQALALFGLTLPVSLAEMKARYKVLVKQNHPDANGGDRQAEERLKAINHAYSVLKRFLS